MQTIAPRARRWLIESRHARVLHVFTRVLNLVNDAGDVLSLAAPGATLTPLTWRVGPGVVPRLARDCTAGTPVAPGPALTLRLGAATLSAVDVPRWAAAPAWAALQGKAWPTPAHSLTAPTLALLAALPGGDPAPAVAALAGRGAGVTPAGDDILIGLLHALWVWQTDPLLCQRLADLAAPRTTTLSAALLLAAAAGEASAPWHRLAAGAADAPAAIQAVGHSSGRDAWYGFVQTMAWAAAHRG